MTVDEMCIWHKSTSIEKENKMYKKCNQTCKGQEITCEVYEPISKYLHAKETKEQNRILREIRTQQENYEV